MMNATLPKMGRPSLSGLSIKLLGPVAYRRQLYELRGGRGPHKKRWTGLSMKSLGRAAYVKAWRRMRITERSPVQSYDIPKSQTNDP